MVRKELIGQSMAMVKAARAAAKKEGQQRPHRRGPPSPAILARLAAKKVPPSWLDRTLPGRLTKYIKPYAMTMQFSNRYVTAHVFDTLKKTLVMEASTKESELRKDLESLSDCVAAARVGETLGERLKEKGIPGVAYHLERGQMYHGKRKAFLDKLRDTGIKFI